MEAADVRAYREEDRAELLALFESAGEGAPTATLWGDLASEAEVYLTPYLDHEPESAFVAMIEDEPVGYLVGSTGRGALPSEDELLVGAVRRHRLLRRRRALAFFSRSMVDAVGDTLTRRPRAGALHDPRWPAHLHINVQRRARGSGLAQGLIAAFVHHLHQEEVPGVHLQTLVENSRAVRFFSAQGFTPHGPTPRVPGLRHEGRPTHQLTMVRSLTAHRGAAGERAR